MPSPEQMHAQFIRRYTHTVMHKHKDVHRDTRMRKKIDSAVKCVQDPSPKNSHNKARAGYKCALTLGLVMH